MNVNRRTVILLVIAVVVIGGVYTITWWQRARETDRLVSEMQSPDHGPATEAITSLRDRVPSIRDRLITLMQHTDPIVRRRAAVLLAELDDADSRDALVAALNDDAATVRAEAAIALGRRSEIAAADRLALMAAADEEAVGVRTAAMQALRRLRTTTYLAEAIAIAEDRPPPPPPDEDDDDEEEDDAEEYEDATMLLRQEAVYAIAALTPRRPTEADIADYTAGDAVMTLAESTDPDLEPSSEVRRAACYALGDLVTRVGDEEVRRSAVRALLGAMEDEVGDVRIAAAHTVRMVPVPSGLRDRVDRALAAAEDDDHYWVRRVAEEAVRGG